MVQIHKSSEKIKDDKNIITQSAIYDDIQLKTAIDTIKIMQKLQKTDENPQGEKNAKR